MKNKTFKKSLSVFLAVLMLMSCWVFFPGMFPTASAADSVVSYPVTLNFDLNNCAGGGHIKIYYYPVKADGTLDKSNSNLTYTFMNSLTQYSSGKNQTFTAGDGDNRSSNDSGKSTGNIPGWPYKIYVETGSYWDWGTKKADIAIKSIKVGKKTVLSTSTQWSCADDDRTFETGGTYDNIATDWPQPSWSNSSTISGTSVQVPTTGSKTVSLSQKATWADQYGQTWPSGTTYSVSGTGVSISQNDNTLTGVTVNSSALTKFGASKTKNVTVTATASGLNKTQTANITLQAPVALIYENLFNFNDFVYSNSIEAGGGGATASGSSIAYDFDKGSITATTGGGEVFTESNSSAEMYSVPVTAGKEYKLDFDVEYKGNIQTFVFFYNDAGQQVTIPGSSNYFYNKYNDETITFTPPTGATKVGFRFGTYGNAGNYAKYSNIRLYETSRQDIVDCAKAQGINRVVYNYDDLISTNTIPALKRPGYSFDKWLVKDVDSNNDGEWDSIPNSKVQKSMVIYSNWKNKVPFDVNYDNLFSFSDWAEKHRVNYPDGTIKVDTDAGTIYMKDTSSTGDDFYTDYGNGWYTMAVKPSTEYAFEFDIEGLEGSETAQFFTFYYQNAQGSTAASTPHEGWRPIGASTSSESEKVDTNGHYSGTFTTPDNCYYLGMRIGTYTDGADMTFKNIAIYEKANKEVIDSITNHKVRDVISKDLTLYTPTRTGYTFAGWVDESGKALTIDEIKAATTSTAVFSTWTINKYTVKFVNAAGTTVSTQTVEHGKTPTVPDENTSANYDSTNHYAYSWPAVSAVTGDVTYTEIKTGTAHSYTTHTDKDDTYHTDKCSCGYSKDVTHSYDSGVVTKEATCTATGVKTYTCSVCNGTKTETIAKKAHNLTKTEAKTATCLAEGNTAYWTCSVCKKLFSDANATTETTADAVKTAKLQHSYTGAIKSDGNGKDATHSFKCVNGCNEYGGAVKHTWNDGTVTTAATCITGGTKTYTCTAEGCGATYTEAIAAAGHNFGDVTEANAATCLAAGNEAYKQCTVCNLYFAENAEKNAADGETDTTSFVIAQLPHSYTGAIKSDGNGKDATHSFKCVNGCDNYGAATKHTWNEGEVTTSATCITGGTKTYTCTAEGCGATYTENIDANGHNFGDVTEANAATCLAAGNEAYKQCTVCNLYFAENAEKNAADGKTDTTSFVIAALGHNYATTFTVDKKATCDTAGSKSKHCSRCSSTTDVTEIPARGHNIVDNGVATAATCTTNGVMNQKCNNTATDEYEACTYTTTRVISATGHNFGDVTEANAATCLAAGNEAYKQCTVCNLYFAENAEKNAADGKTDTTSFVIAQLPHSYTGAIKSDGNGKNATHSFKCVNGCNEYGGAVKHTWNDGEVTTSATCLTGGVKTYTCTAENCGATYTENIDANGHNFGDVTEANAATCLAAGNEAYKQCTVCNLYFAENAEKNAADGETDTTSFVIAQLPHSYTGAIKSDGNGKDATHSFKCVNGCNKYGGAVKHTWNNGAVTTAATCITGGTKTYTCTAEGCGATYTEAIAAAGHTFGATITANAATCENAGNNAYKKCTVCNLYFAENAETDATDGKADTTSFVIAALGHNYATTFTVDKKATCDTAGSKSKHCSRCSSTTDVTEIPARGHNIVDNGVATAATCTTNGVMNQKCNNTATDEYEACTYTTTRVISATGHTFGEWVDEVPAICNKAGTKGHYECSVCHKYFADDKTTVIDDLTIEIASNNHNWVKGETVAPTCTAKGYTNYKCSYCDGEKSSDFVDPLGHYFSDVTAYKAPTCTETGNEAYKSCTSCGKFFAENAGADSADSKDKAEDFTLVIVDDAHDWNEGEITTEPTCTEKGIKTYTCKHNSAHTREEDVSALDHIDADGNGYCDRESCKELICNHEGQGTKLTDDRAATCTVDGYTGDTRCAKCNVITAPGSVIPKLGHKDEDKNHACDNGCDVYQGEHEDENTDHKCDYGCSVAIGTCEDKDKDHDCDYGCDKVYGEHVDADKNHTCDYGCSETIGTHADSAEDKDHVCDYGCGAVLEDCVDNDKDHACDNGCEIYFGEHVDADKNHTCDYGCSEAIGTCEDKDLDHDCDYGCDKVYGTCEDKDLDHKCDYGCGADFGKHEDENTDHDCDYGCSVAIGTCEDADKDHDCDYGCNKVYGEHEDADKNHACDYGCSETIGTHADSAEDKDHVCDYGCGAVLEDCVDNDKDHACDNGCEIYFGEHVDADKNHVCDYGCKVAIGTCEDTDLDHKCDYGCGKSDFGTHEDTDTDHACDYGCKESIGTCEDADKDHDCDYGCEKYFGKHEDENTDHKCDYGCEEAMGTCEDADKDHDCDYGCDKYFGTHEDTDKDHVCDYGCGAVLEDCVDNDKDHACDNGCEIYFGEHVDTDKDHDCDYGCKESIGTCEDNDKDHDCDYGCNKVYGEHVDADKNHVCDYGCKVAIGTCEDTDLDHKCDYGCNKVYGTCEDKDLDHDCDYGCGQNYGEHVDADKNHTCDYGCKEVIGAHTDSDTDDNHVCDYGCGAVIEACVDADPVDGKCDVCGADICKHGEYTHNDRVEATCTSEGNVEYWHCNTCGRNYSDENFEDILTNVEIPVDPNAHKLTHYEAKPSTCIEDGWVEYWSCSECGKNFADSEGKEVLEFIIDEKDGHDWIETAYSFATDGKSCTATRSCKRTGCDVAETAEATVKSEVTTDPTCTENGTTTYTAEFAVDWAETQTTTRVDVAKDSSNHTGEANVTKNYKAATCTEKGYTGDIYWSCCDTLKSKGSEIGIDKDAHTTDKTHIDGYKAPTCITVGATGDEKYDCCNAVKVASKEIPVDADAHTGTADVIKNKKPATCTEKGYTGDTYWSCCDALESKGSEIGINKDAHTTDKTHIDGYKAPTCTTVGATGDEKYDCCNAVKVASVEIPVDANAHTGEANVTKNYKAATCTEKGCTGDTYWSCCDALESKGSEIGIDKDAHTTDKTHIDGYKAPTCTTAGATGDEKYDCCNAVKVASKEIPVDANAHTGTADVIKNKKPATCTEEGYTGDTYWSCCDTLKSKGQTIEALPHTEATRKENVVYPSCGNAGSYDVVTYCSVCSKVISRVTMTDPATGEHNFATVKEKVDATCNTEGYIIRVCGCGAEEKEIIPANDSVHAWETDENGAEKWIISKEPTCVSKGEKICYCTASKGHYKVEYIEPTGHNYEAAENGVVAPSCMNQGYTKYICSKENCGSVEHRDFVAALGHDLVSVVTAPTCDERGYTENYCNRCTYTYTDSYTEATGHADKNGDGKCDGCKENNVSVCSCACHSTNWFIKLIYKIVRFIWKLLKVNADCRCGAIHY